LATEDQVINQLHPGVYSTINAAQNSYTISNGVITLLAVDAFDRGPDGVLNFVSTPEEFKFLYGDPNYDKYGQQAYNIMQWLSSGGQAYVMRILPDDATFAHAVVNIQTKVNVNGKKVHTTDTNEDVFIDDVSLRPTAAFIKKNNINRDILLSELTKLRTSENSIDGYANNFLMLVYPNGRGESYNNLGFRIYANGSYDNIQSSRVYNFETIEYNNKGDETMIEGPFYVSFDQEALDRNGESMFIEDVVNRYSKYLKVKFNTDAFNTICNTINPDVNPNSLDILTGQSMIDLDGKAKTYYNETTKQEEDVHISLHKYNSNGHLISENGRPVLNIPAATDPVEQALVTLDNSTRDDAYNLATNKTAYMKKDFPMLLENDFNPFKLALSKLLNPGTPGDPTTPEGQNETDSAVPNPVGNLIVPAESDIGTPDTGTDPSGLIPKFMNDNLDPENEDSVLAVYNKYKAAYVKDPSEENLAFLTSEADEIVSKIKSTLFDYGNQIDAMFTLTLHGSPNASLEEKYASDKSRIDNLIGRKDKINIFTIQHESKITNIINDITNYQLGLYDGSDLEGIAEVLDNLETEIKYVWESLVPVAYDGYDYVPADIADLFDDSDASSVVGSYNSILQIYEDMAGGYIQDDPENPVNKVKIYSTANDDCNKLLKVINTITFQSTTTLVEDIIERIRVDYLADLSGFHSAILTMITPQGTYDEAAIQQNARQNIDVQNNYVVATNSKFFNTTLLDFNSPIKMLLGSDGAFTYDTNTLAKRSEAIKNQLIKAYAGDVVPEITDSHLYPADLILDARYPNAVKIVISNFVRNMRQDMQFFSDDAGSSFTVSPADAIQWRQQSFNIVSRYVSIFTQAETYYDEYTGRDIKFTTTYPLAAKIPLHATQYGMHYPLAGPRRGIIDGFTDVNWYPNSAYKEKLYMAHLNYLQFDNTITTLGSQSTSETGSGALTNINNMFTILQMKRGAEQLCSNFVFEKTSKLRLVA